MGFLWGSVGLRGGFSCGVSRGGSMGLPCGCLWGLWVSMGSLWGPYRSLWGFYGVSVGPYGVSMGPYRSLWGPYGVSVGLSGALCGVFLWGLPGGFYGAL